MAGLKAKFHIEWLALQRLYDRLAVATTESSTQRVAAVLTLVGITNGESNG